MSSTQFFSKGAVLDVETGLPTKKALEIFVALARRVGRDTTLITLRWLGDTRPTEIQARSVAQALSASKDDADLAVRLDENEFTVALTDSYDATHTFLSRLKEWLEPHLPLSISIPRSN